jgi:hypothetical protein
MRLASLSLLTKNSPSINISIDENYFHLVKAFFIRSFHFVAYIKFAGLPEPKRRWVLTPDRDGWEVETAVKL